MRSRETTRTLARQKKSPAEASAFFGDLFLVSSRVEKSFGLSVQLDADKPAVSIGVLVDFFRSVFQSGVDGRDLAVHGAVNVAGGFDGFHGAHLFLVTELVARRWQILKRDIAKLFLGKRGDAYDRRGTFNADSFLCRGVEQTRLDGHVLSR